MTVTAPASLSYLPVGLRSSLVLGLFFGFEARYGVFMTLLLRPARPDEAPLLTALSLRSKAYWGYDAAFMRACVDELTLKPVDLTPDRLMVATMDEKLAGVARVAPLDLDADLLALFVDPDHMGNGVGRALFDWSLRAARAMGAARLMIEADPGAEPFYARMGAQTIGTAPLRIHPRADFAADGISVVELAEQPGQPAQRMPRITPKPPPTQTPKMTTSPGAHPWRSRYLA